MGILLDGSEHALFDGIAEEVMTLAGTNCPVLWKLSQKIISSVSGATDCLYEEPVAGQKLYVPYRNILCFYEAKNKNSDVGDEGLIERVEGVVHFVRADLEKHKVPLDPQNKDHVVEGDIIQLWANNKLRTWYFKIVQVNRDGWQNDSDVFTHYSCDVVRNLSFTPEEQIVK